MCCCNPWTKVIGFHGCVYKVNEDVCVVLRFSYLECMKWFNFSSILSSVVANVVFEEMSNVVMHKDC